jgi:isoleucyl-tRNA synthetase
VHLLDWPVTGHVDELLLHEMETLRGYITEGLAQRAKAGIKVRQPLEFVAVPYPASSFQDRDFFESILKEELNVKNVEWMPVLESNVGVPEIKIHTVLTPELKREGLMREVVRFVQNARKQAGLNVDDRIVLHLDTSAENLAQAISEHSETIALETLASVLNSQKPTQFTAKVLVEGEELEISLAKA